ncbi:hypothetical protein YC2023_077558 [Brassica napus]
MVPYLARNRTVIDSFELNSSTFSGRNYVEVYKLNEEVSRLEQMKSLKVLAMVKHNSE